MHVTVEIPIVHYDNFLKFIGPSSRAAEILNNAVYHRQAKDGHFERTMEICCTTDELKMLVQLARKNFP